MTSNQFGKYVTICRLDQPLLSKQFLEHCVSENGHTEIYINDDFHLTMYRCRLKILANVDKCGE